MLGRLLAWLGRDGGDGAGEGSVWDLTPDWQYGGTGRFHGGADARDDQESAIEDVAAQAETLAEADDR